MLHNIKNIFLSKKIYKVCLYIKLSMFCILIITACTTNKMNQNHFYCPINKTDNLKYFNDFDKDLLLLKVPKNLDIILPRVNTDYYIPVFDLKKLNNKKDIYSINIYPPIVLEETCSEFQINFD